MKMSRLIIGLSGKDSVTRNAAANFVLAKYLNAKVKQDRFFINRVGKEMRMADSFNSNKTVPIDYPNVDIESISKTYSVRIYNFSDPIKRFCIDNLGLDTVQCYGSEKDQDTLTHISWED